MAIWQKEVDLTLVAVRNQSTLVTHLDIEFTAIGDNFMIARMPVTQQTKQPAGIMHGGVSCVLVETVGSVAGNYCVPDDEYCVGLDINVNHIRAIREGYIYAKGTPFHLGRSTQVWGVEITNEAQQLISVGRLTMAVLKR